MAVGIHCADHATPSIRKCLTSLLTSSGCSVDIVLSWTKSMELVKRNKDFTQVPLNWFYKMGKLNVHFLGPMIQEQLSVVPKCNFDIFRH
jgi:hypothetical protein